MPPHDMAFRCTKRRAWRLATCPKRETCGRSSARIHIRLLGRLPSARPAVCRYLCRGTGCADAYAACLRRSCRAKQARLAHLTDQLRTQSTSCSGVIRQSPCQLAGPPASAKTIFKVRVFLEEMRIGLIVVLRASCRICAAPRLVRDRAFAERRLADRFASHESCSLYPLATGRSPIPACR